MTLSTINWDLEGWDTDNFKKLTDQYLRNFTIHVPRDSGKTVVDVWAKMRLNSAYGYTGVGESMYFTKSKYYNNLCKEIVLPMKPVSKYKFTRTKWYVADLWNSDHNMDEVRAWCVEQFGPRVLNPDAWSRWINHLNSTFRFSNEADYVLFTLRWS
jgi:hypothetical protein